MTLRTGEDILIWRRRLWIALCGGIILEEALDLSWDRILNEWIVFSEAQFETWWWPSARAETCSLSNKYYTTLLVVFRLYYPVSSYLFTLSLVYWRASTLKPDPSVWMIFRRTRNFMPQILDRQSQWLRYLRRGSAAAGFLGLYL